MKGRVTINVGKCKYLLSFHDGISKHKDGSEFWDLRIFSNKKALEAFIKANNIQID